MTHRSSICRVAFVLLALLITVAAIPAQSLGQEQPAPVIPATAPGGVQTPHNVNGPPPAGWWDWLVINFKTPAIATGTAVVGAFLAWLNTAAARKKAHWEKEEAERKEKEAQRLKTNADAERQAALAKEQDAIQKQAEAQEQKLIADQQTVEAQLATAEAQKKQAEAQQTLSELRLPRPAKDNSKRCAMLLLGIGGTGKTNLLHSLYGGRAGRPAAAQKEIRPEYTSEDDPDQPTIPTPPDGAMQDGRTRRVRLWWDLMPWDRRGISLSVVDYVGQNMGTLIRFFAKQQKERLSPVAYGYINAIVILVDLREPPEDEGSEVPKAAEPDWKRVKKNVDAWNWQAISALWGMLTQPRFSAIVLFVNKYDRVETRTDVMEEQIWKKYDGLFQTIRKVFPNRDIHRILGNAATGDGVPQLMQILWDASDD